MNFSKTIGNNLDAGGDTYFNINRSRLFSESDFANKGEDKEKDGNTEKKENEQNNNEKDENNEKKIHLMENENSDNKKKKSIFSKLFS